MNNQIIYIAGPDGSGKTTFLKDIEEYYVSKGIITRHIWLRSPKIFSKPLMLYCRLAGLTEYKVIDGVKYGKHEFYRSSFVSKLFPFLQLLDFKKKWLSVNKNIKEDEVILFDRFSLDTLADLMVDTGRMDLYKTKTGKAFLNLIPENTKLIVLKVDEKTIRARKKDTLHDEHLNKKIEVFERLSKNLNLTVIDNNREYNIVKKDIIDYLGLDAGN